MNELLDKQVNVLKEKIFWVHVSSRKPTKKVCDENEETRKKQRTRKNVFNGRKWFINHMRGTGETDCYEVLIHYKRCSPFTGGSDT